MFGNEVDQQQDSIESFVIKLKLLKSSSNFGLHGYSENESLILQAGMKDALNRAAYINSGTDGIMIHSRKNLMKSSNFV